MPAHDSPETDPPETTSVLLQDETEDAAEIVEKLTKDTEIALAAEKVEDFEEIIIDGFAMKCFLTLDALQNYTIRTAPQIPKPQTQEKKKRRRRVPKEVPLQPSDSNTMQAVSVKMEHVQPPEPLGCLEDASTPMVENQIDTTFVKNPISTTAPLLGTLKRVAITSADSSPPAKRGPGVPPPLSSSASPEKRPNMAQRQGVIMFPQSRVCQPPHQGTPMSTHLPEASPGRPQAAATPQHYTPSPRPSLTPNSHSRVPTPQKYATKGDRPPSTKQPHITTDAMRQLPPGTWMPPLQIHEHMHQHQHMHYPPLMHPAFLGMKGDLATQQLLEQYRRAATAQQLPPGVLPHHMQNPRLPPPGQQRAGQLPTSLPSGIRMPSSSTLPSSTRPTGLGSHPSIVPQPHPVGIPAPAPINGRHPGVEKHLPEKTQQPRSQKSSQWATMHVKIAWMLHRAQKEALQSSRATPSAAPVKSELVSPQRPPGRLQTAESAFQPAEQPRRHPSVKQKDEPMPGPRPDSTRGLPPDISSRAAQEAAMRSSLAGRYVGQPHSAHEALLASISQGVAPRVPFPPVTVADYWRTAARSHELEQQYRASLALSAPRPPSLGIGPTPQSRTHPGHAINMEQYRNAELLAAELYHRSAAAGMFGGAHMSLPGLSHANLSHHLGIAASQASTHQPSSADQPDLAAALLRRQFSQLQQQQHLPPFHLPGVTSSEQRMHQLPHINFAAPHSYLPKPL